MPMVLAPRSHPPRQGGYAGVLVYPSGHELPMSFGVGPEPRTPARRCAGPRSSSRPWGPEGGARRVTVDTTVYRRNHGAEPRGFGNWLVRDRGRSYEYSDDPAPLPTCRDSRCPQGRPASDSPTARQKKHAIAEARRRWCERRRRGSVSTPAARGRRRDLPLSRPSSAVAGAALGSVPWRAMATIGIDNRGRRRERDSRLGQGRTEGHLRFVGLRAVEGVTPDSVVPDLPPAARRGRRAELSPTSS